MGKTPNETEQNGLEQAFYCQISEVEFKSHVAESCYIVIGDNCKKS